MKTLTLLLALACPLLLTAQHVVTASVEPGDLYQKDYNHFIATGNIKEALKFFEKGVSDLVRQGRTDELPEQYFGMAFNLALNGNYKESIRYHKKAMRIHREVRNDEPLEISLNLGLTYYLAGKDRKARRILGDTI